MSPWIFCAIFPRPRPLLFPGRQIYAEGRAGAERVLLKARFVVVGNRLYQIAYAGAKDGVAMADVDMFLSSFKLLNVNKP